MDDDPYDWPPSRVQEFFRRDAADLLGDFPNWKLPNVESFVRILGENDVSGAVLLTAVDTAFLREDCNIRSLGVRSTVMHCINKLRELSDVQRAVNIAAKPYQVEALREASPPKPVPSAGAQKHADLVPGTDVETAVGPQTRSGEVTVEDTHGRKRRKLYIQPTVQEEDDVTISEAEKNETRGYLPPDKHSVDKTFFGQTKIGHVIDHVDLAPGKMSDAMSFEDDTNVFQLTGNAATSGLQDCVYARMKHFLLLDPIADNRLQRGEQLLWPYPEAKLSQSKDPSAILFKWHSLPGQTSKIVSLRVNAKHLDPNGNGNLSPQDDNVGAFDDLYKRWQDQAEGEVLPPLGESDTASITSSLDREIEEERLELEEAKTKPLPNDDVVEIINKTIHSFAQTRKDHLNEREEHDAWRIWRKMRERKSVRDKLVGQAQARIKTFDKRLQKYKDEICRGTWWSEANIREICEIARVTVYDREDDRWKISIWQRRRKPPHSLQAVARDARFRVREHENLNTLASTIGRSDDRMSFSPQSEAMRTASEQPAIESIESIVQLDDGDNEFMDQTSVSRSPATASSDLVVADSPTSVNPSLDERNTPHVVELIRPGPITNTMHLQSADVSAISNSPAGPVTSSVQGPTALDEVAQWQKTPFRIPPGLTLKQTSDDTDSVSSAPSQHLKLAVKGRPVSVSGDPLHHTAAEVAQWSVDDLCRSSDRVRLLIKLISDLDEDRRTRLHNFVRHIKKSEMSNSLQVAFVDMQSEGVDDDSIRSSTPVPGMTLTARLFLSWLLLADHVWQHADVKWIDVFHSLKQAELFHTHLRAIMNKLTTRLFVSPVRFLPSVHQTPVVIISSESENEDETMMPSSTPSKLRRRLVKQSAMSKESQAQALDRQHRYQMALAGHSSNSELLGQMVESAVYINPLVDDERDFIYVHDDIARVMKDHQVDGVRFMWRELTAEGRTDPQGCILAHVMGLGKTIQSIALLIALDQTARSEKRNIYEQLPKRLRSPDLRNGQRQLRMLVLCPPQLLQNWRREIGMWAPTALKRVILIESVSKESHLDQLREWHCLGGVLLIGYELFRSRVTPRKLNENPSSSRKIDKDIEEYQKYLFESPEVLIVDEAQKLKSERSDINRAVNKITTRSKVALTGTPMSNDVQEVYALVSLVAPGYLGPPKQFRAHFAEPIAIGTSSDSTVSERRVGIKKLALLRKKIDPKVDRRDITVLKGALKSKVEFVITLGISDAQRDAYIKFVNIVLGRDEEREWTQVEIFAWLAVLTLLTNHPLAFRRKLLTPIKPAVKKHKRTISAPSSDDKPEVVTPGEDDSSSDLDEALRTLGLSDATIAHLTSEISDELHESLSPKMEILIEILTLAKECGDKVLVFSSSIPTLDYLSELMAHHGVSYGRIDGRVPIIKRTGIVDDFNQNKADVMLLSTRAGVGLNIQGANRVVIVDFGFNPAHELQAIGRAYRLGQPKPVFVYRLKCGGTFEMNVHNKQLFKQSLSLRVVDKKNPQRNAQRDTREWLHEPRPVQQEEIKVWKGKDPAVMDKIIQRLEMNCAASEDKLIRSLSTMETLQEEDHQDQMTAEETREVELEYEHDLACAEGRWSGYTINGFNKAPAVPAMPSTQVTYLSPNLQPAPPVPSGPAPASTMPVSASTDIRVALPQPPSRFSSVAEAMSNAAQLEHVIRGSVPETEHTFDSRTADAQIAADTAAAKEAACKQQ